MCDLCVINSVKARMLEEGSDVTKQLRTGRPEHSVAPTSISKSLTQKFMRHNSMLRAFVS